MKKMFRQTFFIIAVLAAALFMPFQTKAAPGAVPGTIFPGYLNPEPETLVSTQTTFINGMFFTVDCYHDRIIYNDSCDPSLPLMQWKVMADDLNKPHSICSDGLIYMVVDTDNNRVVTYTRLITGEFMELQSFEGVGIRPHYCVYDAATASFYVWSSYTGEMYIYKRTSGFSVKLSSVKKLPILYGIYTRSFTIDGNNIILCSQGAGGLIVVNKRTFKIVAAYRVTDELGGVVQVAHVGNHYYLTTSSDRFGNQNMARTVRSDSLAGFTNSAFYTDVTAELGGVSGIQVPYYMTDVNGIYFVRFMGVGGYPDCGSWFTEDMFGNIILGGKTY
ncbi:MAG: hypothetical protein K6G43_02520 [Lachnospiraceae bacterium]|nr:hypothetical protein [Lachnospiraceae bacterium]